MNIEEQAKDMSGRCERAYSAFVSGRLRSWVLGIRLLMRCWKVSASSTMTIPVSLVGASDQETDDSLRGLGGHDDCRYSESSQAIAQTEVPGIINEEGTKGCRADPIDTSSALGGYS